MNTEFTQAAAMRAANFRWDRKGCKLATFDLILPFGLILRGATLQESHGKQWVGLPASRYEKPGGCDGWVSIINFTSPAIKERFDRAKPMLEAAIQWTQRGLPVFPLQPRSKIPFAGTKGCKDATRDEDIIRKWWRRSPRANIGIATGFGHFVIDLDGEDAQNWFLSACGRHGDPEPTLTVKTARGVHLFYRASIEIPNSASMLAPHVDVRGTGGYVCAAPSVHPSGFRYTIINEVPIAEAPRWLTDLAIPEVVAPVITAAQWPRTNQNGQLRGFLGVIRVAAEAAPGERNQKLFWAACRLKEIAAEGLISHTEGEACLIEAAMRAGLPPFEIKRTLSSALKAGSRG